MVVGAATKRKGLTRTRAVLLFTLLYVAGFGALFRWFYVFTSNEAVSQLRQNLRAVATGAQRGMNVDELITLYRTGERNPAGFSDDPRYARQLDWFAKIHELDPHAWPYTFIRGNRPDTRRVGDERPENEFVYITDLNARFPERADKAARFLEPDRGSPAALEALATGKLVERPGIYRDRFGSWMSVYLPLTDAAGSVVAILGVDYDASYVHTVEASVRNQMLVIFGIAYVVLTLLVLFVYRARSLRTMFGRYASLALLRDDAMLELGYASRRRVTVMFIDINEFSGQCERHAPDAVIQMLNSYFATTTEIIVASGGWIKQYVGDEIMVMYNAPEDHPRPEHAAVQAALSIIHTLRELEAAATAPGFFQVKIGIHSGDVIVGNVGSKHRTEYAAVGDDVNLGSRIMNMSKALDAQVLISRATYERVKDLPGVELVDRGMHPVKGRRQGIQVYAVSGSLSPQPAQTSSPS